MTLINPESDPELLVPLAIIKENGGEVKGKTKFQKLTFLAEEEKSLDKHYEFQKYNHGPYSFDLADNIDTLINLNLIKEETRRFIGNDFDGKRHEFSLTQKGEELVSKFEDSEKFQEIRDGCRESTEEWGESSLQDILDYVYDKYM